jgi:prepilin-type N-terminal cleavage/methylation domain-containing protein
MRINKTTITNEKGITLIELLAVLALFSIILMIMYSSVSNSFIFNKKTFDHLSLRQHTNLILAQLTTIHQSNNQYELKYESGKIYVKEYDDTVFRLLGKEELEYDIVASSNNKTLNDPNDTGGAQPTLIINNNFSLKLRITVTNPNNNDSLSIDTIIARLKGGG